MMIIKTIFTLSFAIFALAIPPSKPASGIDINIDVNGNSIHQHIPPDSSSVMLWGKDTNMVQRGTFTICPCNWIEMMIHWINPVHTSTFLRGTRGLEFAIVKNAKT
ncbi:hypothetical protein BC826DRAFT_968136 [Russula brevipes]|nr:hypothetical protein BC826DRAFT_968136 [Russula brevipes]